jgi:hypothetical protein
MIILENNNTIAIGPLGEMVFISFLGNYHVGPINLFFNFFADFCRKSAYLDPMVNQGVEPEEQFTHIHKILQGAAGRVRACI